MNKLYKLKSNKVQNCESYLTKQNNFFIDFTQFIQDLVPLLEAHTSRVLFALRPALLPEKRF